MKGSKYADETREKALALIAGGKTATATARLLGLPKSTVCHWHEAALEGDEDFIARRAEERRLLIRKCYGVVRKAVGAIDRQMTDAVRERGVIADGLKVLQKAAKDGVIALSEAEVKALSAVVRDYTGTGMREISDVMRRMDEQALSLETRVRGGDAEGAMPVEVEDLSLLADRLKS